MLGARLLARNTALNFAGQLIPLAAAAVAVPLLVRTLGTDRFAILLLVWSAVGYFSLLDLGIGRALTQAVASRLGSGRQHDLSRVTWTALWCMAALGVVAGAIVAALTPLLVTRVLHVPIELRGEAAVSFYILATVLPLMLVTLGLRGVFEAFQDFGVATALRVPLGVLMYVAAIAPLPFSHSLVPIVASLLCVRGLGLVLHLAFCLRQYEFLRQDMRPQPDLVWPLIRIGGWMTVSNVVSPLMVNMDRFIIGAMLPVASVAYYVTPYELVTKLWIIPASLQGVLFPAFALSFATDAERTSRLLDRATRLTLIGIFPFALALVCLGREGLTLWLNPTFAREGTAVLQWLAVGVLINCVAQMPFTALQGIGRPDIPAKFHLFELPVYAFAIWLLIRSFGLVGVAMAWTARVTLDLVLLWGATARQLPAVRAPMAHAIKGLSVFVLVLGAAALMPNTWARVTTLSIVLPISLAAAWVFYTEPSERAALRDWLRPRARPLAGA